MATVAPETLLLNVITPGMSIGMLRVHDIFTATHQADQISDPHLTGSSQQAYNNINLNA